MQRNILWKGIEYNSLEHCMLTSTESGSEVKSTIIGSYHTTIYKVEYEIHTNQFWETTFVEITSQLDDKIFSISLRSDGKGNWTSHNKLLEAYQGCIDVDISLTPFTNTLPINRLKLSDKQQKQISVLCVDILNKEMKPVQQKYTRLSKNTFRFENVPNDFEADISIDEFGIVLLYPQLFTCALNEKTN